MTMNLENLNINLGAIPDYYIVGLVVGVCGLEQYMEDNLKGLSLKLPPPKDRETEEERKENRKVYETGLEDAYIAGTYPYDLKILLEDISDTLYLLFYGKDGKGGTPKKLKHYIIRNKKSHLTPILEAIEKYKKKIERKK